MINVYICCIIILLPLLDLDSSLNILDFEISKGGKNIFKGGQMHPLPPLKETLVHVYILYLIMYVSSSTAMLLYLVTWQ